MQNRSQVYVDSFFLNRLEHKYTCIHLDDMWCFKVPSPGGSSFNGCLGAVHYNLQRCSGWGDLVRNPEPLSYPPYVCTANTLIHSLTPSLTVALSISFNVSPIPTYMPFPPFCPDFQWVAVPQCLLLRQSQGPPHGLPYKYMALMHNLEWSFIVLKQKPLYLFLIFFS